MQDTLDEAALPCMLTSTVHADVSVALPQLGEEPLVIGRALALCGQSPADVPQAASVSRQHVRIEADAAGLTVTSIGVHGAAVLRPSGLLVPVPPSASARLQLGDILMMLWIPSGVSEFPFVVQRATGGSLLSPSSSVCSGATDSSDAGVPSVLRRSLTDEACAALEKYEAEMRDVMEVQRIQSQLAAVPVMMLDLGTLALEASVFPQSPDFVVGTRCQLYCTTNSLSQGWFWTSPPEAVMFPAPGRRYFQPHIYPWELDRVFTVQPQDVIHLYGVRANVL